MRALAGTAVALFAVGCASEPGIVEAIWPGPPITAQRLDGGGMRLTIVAPTASHGLEVVDVEHVGDTAEVTARWTTPGDAYTAQVLTPINAEVDAARLGDCSRVRFWVVEAPRGASTEGVEPVLAVVQRR